MAKKLEIGKISVASLIIAFLIVLYNFVFLAIQGSFTNALSVLLLSFILDGLAISFISFTLINLFSKFKFGFNVFTILSTIVIVGLTLLMSIFSYGSNTLFYVTVGIFKSLFVLAGIYIGNKI